MRRVVVLLSSGLVVLALCGCGGGMKSSKNQFGAPKLSVPKSAGTAAAFEVPADLIPPGATVSKANARTYVTMQRASAVKEFFAGALKGANIETTREGEHVTVSNKTWLIEIYGGGADNTETAIVYAKQSEVK